MFLSSVVERVLPKENQMKSVHLKIQVLVVLLLFAALFPLIHERAFSLSPVYLTVEPKALAPLTDINASIYGLEVPATPSAVGDNFTISLHIRNATLANVPRGINGIEVHFYFGNILSYAVPTGFTSYIGVSGGVLISPVLYGLNPGFYASNGTRIPNPPYTGSALYKVSAASTGGVWNGQDGAIANMTFRIVKQPQSNETSVSFSLDYNFGEYDTTTVDPNTGEILNVQVFPDSISGSLALDSNYIPPPNYTLTVQQNPANAGTVNVKVNGINQTAPYIFVNGTVVQVTATPNTGYAFSNWTLDGSNAGSSNPYNITMNSNHTVTANYQTQYYLTVTSPYDSPTPPSGWFNPGTIITESVTSPMPGPSGTRYVCTGWTGTGSVPASGSDTHLTFTISMNSSITWNWATQYQVTFSQIGVSSDFTGTIVTIDATGYNYSMLPVSLWWNNGSLHTFSFSSPLVASLNKRYVWTSTSGLSTLQGDSITVGTTGSVTGNFKVQYYLTVETDPDGIAIIPGEGWYDAMQNVTLTAPPVTDYQFNYWDIDGNSQGVGVDPINVTMNTAHIATAHYASILPINHDIAVTNVTIFKTVIGQGLTMNVTVTIMNQGDSAESFNLTVYANQTAIASQENISLAAGNLTTITLILNVTGFGYGNYVIWAYSVPVLGETNVTNNNCTGGTIWVSIPGDVNGNFRVNLQDLVLLGIAYNTTLEMSPKWNPNADFDNDGIVGLPDLVTLANHYGQHYP